MKVMAGVVALTVILFAGSAAGQYLKERLSLGGYSGENYRFQVDDRDGWNSPSSFEMTIQKEQYDGATLEAPGTTVFTSGNLKREADRALSKVLDGYDTKWGKRFVYNEPSFVGTITFVEASSREIGVYLQISKSDYEIGLEYRDVWAGTTENSVEYVLKKPEQRSNVGTPGEHVFVLSSRDEVLLYGPPSPVPHAKYHEVKNAESPLKDAISPNVDGVDLRFSFRTGPGARPRNSGIRGGRRGEEEDGATYRDSVHLEVGGQTFDGAPPGYSSRSTSSEDMNYVKSLTTKVSSSYSPVQATFIQLVSLTESTYEIDGYDVDVQMIISVDASGRPAMILNFGKSRPARDPRSLVVRYSYRRVFQGDRDRGFKHEKQINLGLGFDRTSNIDQEGVWVFLVSEDGTGLVGDDTTRDVETPSLYKFCSQGTVDVLVKADELTKSSFLNLEKLGWTGKWRKKSLGYLRDWREGTSLSHFRGSILKKAGSALGNYELKLKGVDWEERGDELKLQRFCLVSDSNAMEQIARDTKTAGLDASMPPEMALVLEYEVVQRNVPGTPRFTIEHVFASFPGRETIALVANFPPAPEVRLDFSTHGRTQCDTSRDIYELSSESSNTGVEGRFVVVYDGSREYGNVQPEGASVQAYIGECDDYAAPCDGECPAGYSCQKKGSKAMCVNCGNFVRADEDEWPQTCCKLNPTTNRCMNNRTRFVEKCMVENPDYFRVIDGRPMVFPVDAVSVCNRIKNFKRNGGACELKDGFNARGNRRCYFQHKRAV